MALHQRQPEGRLYQSDQGTQYTSMGSVGDASNDVLCESFFASLKCELIDRITLPSFTHDRREVLNYIED